VTINSEENQLLCGIWIIIQWYK